jgi:Holliday junction DNA helicase RuvA
MIGSLRGKIIQKDTDHIILDVSGVGYIVYVTNNFLSETTNLNISDDILIYTHLAVRETALDLYGFNSEEDKKLFELLLTINGVGPKSALNIMNSVTKDMIEESISKDDPKYLAKISGIGKKTAEKILIGLKDKFGDISIDKSEGSDNSVAIEALVSLGYSERDSREVVKGIDTKDKGTEEIIKEALKDLTN